MFGVKFLIFLKFFKGFLLKFKLGKLGKILCYCVKWFKTLF